MYIPDTTSHSLNNITLGGTIMENKSHSKKKIIPTNLSLKTISQLLIYPNINTNDHKKVLWV